MVAKPERGRSARFSEGAGGTPALPGRKEPIPTASRHFVNGRPLKGPYPEGFETAIFGLGCFWGAERKFWELGDRIHVTAVGYAGGLTPNPTYQEVCTGQTGHNDVGTQYRSGIYVNSPARRAAAEASKAMYERAIAARGYGAITTEIVTAPEFYFAEDYHQQYLAKNPSGYCGLAGTGVSCPIGTGVGAATA